jgi:hypothetical protein
MTIKFFCPKCGELIAFEDKHARKRARCISCHQQFIIPDESNQVPELIIPEKVDDDDPLEGYYKALFIQTWRLFIDPENTTTIVFVIAVVCFKFFLAKGICCCGPVTHFIAWGWLFGFYFNCVNENAFDIDKMPEIYIGTIATFAWYVIKPFLIFAFTMTIVQMPFILGLIFLEKYGLTLTNFWTLKFGLNTILQVLFAFGMFIFPMAILTMTVGQDITLLRIDYFAKPIKKATKPYLTTFILMLILAAAVIITFPMQYDIEITTPINALYLAANIAVQLIAIFTMRSIALFYRHYNCYMKW